MHFNGAASQWLAICHVIRYHVLDMSKRINVYVIQYDTRKVSLAKRELPAGQSQCSAIARRTGTYPPYLSGS